MKKPETKLQEKCIEYLTEHKIYYINMYGSGRTAKGAPDLITCIGGRFVAFELKAGDNAMDDAQIIHMRRIKRSGGWHFCPYTLEEFTEIVRKLVRGEMDGKNEIYNPEQREEGNAPLP